MDERHLHPRRHLTDLVEADGPKWETVGLGGSMDTPSDTCYHLPCDTVGNVDPVLLGQVARAAAWVTGYLADGGAELGQP